MSISSDIIIEILDKYLDEKIKEKHKTCLTDQFDNGYFWALKELQEFMHKKIG